MTLHRGLVFVVAMTAVLAGADALGQVTRADYDRALGLREKYEALAVGMPESATWVPNTPRFWYRRTVSGGQEFVLMDAATLQKRPASGTGWNQPAFLRYIFIDRHGDGLWIKRAGSVTSIPGSSCIGLL